MSLDITFEGYRREYVDDFDAPSISPDGTGDYDWYPGLWWLPALPPSPNITVKNSILTLTWTRGQSPGSTDLSGISRDWGKIRAYGHGIYTARMRWTPAVGLWSAFWLLPDTNRGHRGEIDAAEGLGAVPLAVYTTAHEWVGGDDVWNNAGANVATMPAGFDPSRFHAYSVRWTPGVLAWFIDGIMVNESLTTPAIEASRYSMVLSIDAGVNWVSGDLTGVTANSFALDVNSVEYLAPR